MQTSYKILSWKTYPEIISTPLCRLELSGKPQQHLGLRALHTSSTSLSFYMLIACVWKCTRMCACMSAKVPPYTLMEGRGQLCRLPSFHCRLYRSHSSLSAHWPHPLICQPHTGRTLRDAASGILFLLSS